MRTEESLLDEVKDIKWDIIGLCETKRERECITDLKGGTWLYNYEKTEDNTSAKGIGFLIHPKFTDFVKEIIKCYSNQVTAVQVQLTENNHLCVVQVYAPTSDRPRKRCMKM